MMLRRYHEELKEETVEFEGLTVKQIKELLDQAGIKYDAKGKKDDLIKLLKGAE